MNNPSKIRLHVLSPIHIGCDDVYEPTSFVIDETRKKLIEFDPIDFVKSLTPQEMAEFNKVATGDNLLAIFKLIKRFYKPAIKGREVEITDYLVSHYKRILSLGTFDKKTVINQFTMNKTAYNPQDNIPYIPGTSLKGALRTAYISALAVSQKVTNSQNAKRLETDLLCGNFETDPFRMVKISDLLPLENSHSKIFYAVNKKKKLSDKASRAESGPPQIFEAIKPETLFEGVISIQIPERGSGIKNPIKKDDLLKASQRFYSAVLNDDEKAFHVLKIKNISSQQYFKQFKDKFNNTAFLIRLGRHSGAEAVTIEGNRNIKIMGKGNEFSYKDHATTLWLAAEEPRPQNTSNLLPFGWAVLEILPFDVKNIYPPRIQRVSESDARRVEARQSAEKESAHKAAEESRIRQIEEERKRKDAEALRRKEEWEALSEEERLIRTPAMPDVTEQQVVECFGKLDSLSSPHKERLAESIRQYYIRNGKWEGGSKKQVEKVKKLKAILGDVK